MTKTEYQAWKEETERSRTRWNHDQVRHHNTGDWFFYKGGTSGQFIEVRWDGTASLGTYEGAIPNIGEACFRVLHERKFTNQKEALTSLIERAGLQFLLNFLGY